MKALRKKSTNVCIKCNLKYVLLSLFLFVFSSRKNVRDSTHRVLQIMSEEIGSLDHKDNIKDTFDPILFDLIVVGTERRFPTPSENLFFEIALSRYLSYELSKQGVIISSVKLIQEKSSMKERPIQGPFEKSGGRSDSEDINVRRLAIFSEGIAELFLTVSIEGSSTSLDANQLDFPSLVKHIINEGSTGIIQNLIYSSIANDEVKVYYKGVRRVICTGFRPIISLQNQSTFRVNSYDVTYAAGENNDGRYNDEAAEKDTSVKGMEISPLPKTLDIRALHYRNVFGIILVSLCSMFVLMNAIRIGRKKNEKRKMRIHLAKQAFEGPRLKSNGLGKGTALEPFGPCEKYLGTMDDGIIAEKHEYLRESGIVS